MAVDETLISIIVPVFNGERYLKECLESIAGQSYPHFEAIIINDGSTDNSLAIIKDFAERDRRFKFIVQVNQGQAMARNRGLDVSIGEYITMIDADDTVDSRYLELLLHTVKETGADIAIAKITNYQSLLGKGRYSFKLYDTVEYLSSILFKSDIYTSACGRIYHRRIWDQLRFRKLYYEDLDIFPHVLLLATTLACIPVPLYYYRENEHSFINTFSSKRLDVLKVTDDIIKFIDTQSFNKTLRKAARARKLCANFNMFLLTSGNAALRDVHLQCWATIRAIRTEFLFSYRIPLKLRLGILLSFFGSRLLLFVNRLVKVSH